MRIRLATLLASILVLAACSGGGGDSSASTTSSEPPTTGETTTTLEPATTTTEPGTDDTDDADPPSGPIDNAFVILGDTLGIGEACAGRDGSGNVEYRYELSNGGTLSLTIDGGAAVGVSYQGRSGIYRAGSDAVTDQTVAGDGFVTGTGTATKEVASGEVPDASDDTAITFRATIPIRNCSTPVEETTTTVVEDTTTTEA